MLSEFERGYSALKTIKSISYAKVESRIDQSRVNKLLNKFRSTFKILDDQERPSRPKTVDFEALFKAKKKNRKGSTPRISDDLGISQSSVVRHLHDLSKSSE